MYASKYPLHTAALKGDIQGVRTLLESKDACTTSVDAEGDQALHKAVEAGHLDIVRCLVSHNASVTHANNANRTPLHNCCNNRWYPNIAEFLIDQRANVNAKTRMGWTALMGAAVVFRYSSGRALKLIRVLLERGANTEEVAAFEFCLDADEAPALELLEKARKFECCKDL